MTTVALALLFFGGYVAFLYYVSRYFWRRFKNEGKNTKTFTYRITDIWAAMLALTPTLALIGLCAQNHGENYSEWGLLATTMLSGQLIGIFIGRTSGTQPEKIQNNALASAVLIIVAGVLGLFLPVLYYMLLCAIGIVFIIMIPFVSVLLELPLFAAFLAALILVLWRCARSPRVKSGSNTAI